MSGDLLALGAVAALAAVGAVRRGSRNEVEVDYDTVNRAMAQVPELVARIVSEQEGERYEPDEVEDFHLADYGGGLSPAIRVWWKQSTGLEYLGVGNFRAAFRMPDGQVLKLALDYWGQRANSSEIEAWNTLSADPEVADFLVPLRAGNEDYVVMDYAAPLDFPTDQRAWKQRERAWGDLLWTGRAGTVDDTSRQNWGRHQGKIKLLDYEETGG